MNKEEIVRLAMCAIETGDMTREQSLMISGVISFVYELASELSTVQFKARIDSLIEQKDDLLIRNGKLGNDLIRYENALSGAHERIAEAYLKIDRLQTFKTRVEDKFSDYCSEAAAVRAPNMTFDEWIGGYVACDVEAWEELVTANVRIAELEAQLAARPVTDDYGVTR